MSKTTTGPSSTGQEAPHLGAYLLACTVPFRSGGGLVFPIGFPGRGYRLDKQQFDRFRQEVAELVLRGATARRRRLLIAGTVVYGIACIAGAIAAGLTMSPEAILQSVGYILPAILLCILAAVFLVLRAQVTKFRKRFPAAAPVSRFEYVERRILGTLVGEAAAPRLFRLQIMTLALTGIIALQVAAFSGLLTAIAPLVIFAGYALAVIALVGFYAYHLLVLRRFRLKHGRGPTRDDLLPV